MFGFVFSLIMIIFVWVPSQFIYGQGTSTSSKHQAILSLTNNLQQLAEILPGSYDNSQQHQAFPKDFHHLRLEVQRIWSDRDDAVWLYVEQALYDLPEAPHHQWVYKIFRGERDTLIGEIYSLENASTAIRKGHDKAFWKEQHPNQLSLRQGCAIRFVRRCNGYFVGSTHGSACSSPVDRADFIQSQVAVSLDALKLWEQGFDAGGKKVWGPDKGAYLFDRRSMP
jgi:hypothetical protein